GRGDEGQLEGAQEDGGVGAHAGVVGQSGVKGGGGKGVNHHDKDGGNDEQGHPPHIGHGQERAPVLHGSPPLPPRAPGWRRRSHRTPRSWRSSPRTGRSTGSSSSHG